ncbi:MAG: YegP family protein [Aeromicrobium sp.]
MTAPRFEIVVTNAGHHARSIAANGQVVLTSETYSRREAARNAIRITAQLFSVTPVYFDQVDGVMYVHAAGMRVPMVDVDERTPPAPAPVAEPPYWETIDGRWHDSDYHWRFCTDQCTEGTPPDEAEVAVRFGKVTYAGGEA